MYCMKVALFLMVEGVHRLLSPPVEIQGDYLIHVSLLGKDHDVNMYPRRYYITYYSHSLV